MELEGGTRSPLIPKSRILPQCGLAVVRIGDFATEVTMLDPLAKSVTQFSRLLLEDSGVRLLEARSLPELSTWWTQNGAVYTHVLLIGHGAADGVLFGVGGKASPGEFASAFSGGGSGKTLISLACLTGRKEFAKPVSLSPPFKRVIAPFQSVHAAIASQFAQTYLASHLLMGRTPKIAWRDARRSTPGTDSFRMWVNGCMEHSPAG